MTDIDDIFFAIRYCKEKVASFEKACQKINDGAQLVKIPNQLISDITYTRKDGSISILADLLANFRTIDRKPVGHLNTLNGVVPIPRFWPITSKITTVWGYPSKELIVDAYVLSKELNKKIDNCITELPMYPVWE